MPPTHPSLPSPHLTIPPNSLLDPAYSEIGPLTCVGMTGGWASYSWPPALALLSCLITFLLDFAAERYVENKYGLNNSGEINVENIITDAPTSNGHGHHAPAHVHDLENRSHSHSHDSAHATSAADAELATKKEAHLASSSDDASTDADSIVVANAFRTQIAAFLVLEFGVIFHSVIIGLALGSAGAEFGVLYPVIVFVRPHRLTKT
jgi:zinc transporter 1/2/3